MNYPHQSGRSCAPLACNLDASLGSARLTDVARRARYAAGMCLSKSKFWKSGVVLQGVTGNLMKLSLMRSLVAAAILVSASAVAQTSGAPSTALPAAPSAANDPPALGTGTTGSKIGAINVEQAISPSNEGHPHFSPPTNQLRPHHTNPKTQTAPPQPPQQPPTP